MYKQPLLIISEKLHSKSEFELFYKPEKNSSIRYFDKEDDKLSIGVDKIDEILSWIYLKSSDLRVVVVFNSHTMTIEAQNKLLKVSEESPNNSHLILICDNEESIIQTLRSRFELIYLNDSISKKTINIDELLEHSFFTRESVIEQFIKNNNTNDFKNLIEDSIKYTLNKYVNINNKSKEVIEYFINMDIKLNKSSNKKIFTYLFNIGLEKIINLKK